MTRSFLKRLGASPHPLAAISLAATCLAAAASPSLVISEFLADNESGPPDSFGEASDWIELWNSSDQPVLTDGWYLSDDPDEPTLWALPAITIAAGDYLLVRASGRDLRDEGGELHTNFRLSRTAGDALLLSMIGGDASVTVVSSFAPYPDQYADTSYGLSRQDGSGATGYFAEPSPGGANLSGSLLGFVADTKFSVDRGFHDEPFSVVVSSQTPGASLIYTTDGSWPSESHGIRVDSTDEAAFPAAVIDIPTTTNLRVMAVKEGLEPTNVDTHTYVFPEHVLAQDGQGAPFDQAVDWGHAGPDWEMDPEVVDHADPEVAPTRDDLKRIPTVSLSVNFDEMFGAGGIYIAGQDVEKNVSIEYLNPDGSIDAPNSAEGFQVDGTVQIVGGTSPQRWKSDNLSMRLKFDRDLRYPVFGDGAADRFDTLVLDAHLGEVWHYGGTSSPEVQRDRAQYARDQFAADMHQEVGGLSPHGKTVLLYINGIYWGMHTLHERPDDDFAASYLGGDKEDYNVVKHNINTSVSGTLDSYRELHELADRDLSVAENFEAVAALLDIDAFIDYIIVNYYLGNTDWGHQNWYASRNQVVVGGRWMFHSWDAENVMNFLSDDASARNNAGGPTNLQHDLAANAGYRLRFADRVHHHFHNDGAMTPGNASELYLKRTDPIDHVMRLESARWGDNQRVSPYTRLDWIANRERLIGVRTDGAFGDYFNRRPDVVLGQLRNRGWYPNTGPPAFSQHGGRVANGFELAISNPGGGVIYYTTDGSDPRLPGVDPEIETSPLVGADALKRAVMPTDDASVSTWMLPEFDDSSWPGGTMGAGYDRAAGGGDFAGLIDPALDFGSEVDNLTIESIHMRVEFTLEGEPDLNVLRLGARYDDGFVAYLNGTEIHRENAPGSPGAALRWFAEATDSHADTAAVDFVSFDVSSHVGLLKFGKNVLAIHALNRGASSSDFLIWPTLEGARSEGGSPTGVSDTATAYSGPLTLDQSATIKARVLSAGEWSPLTAAPFVVGLVAPLPSNLVVSKVHYRPAAPGPEELLAGFTSDTDFEYLELMNVGTEPVDLAGVVFSEGIDFEFDSSSMRDIQPSARILLVRRPEAFEMRYGSGLPVAGSFANDTGLNDSGEFIALRDDGGEIIQRFRYDDVSPWPVAPDGGGPALILRDPGSAPDHGLAENWTASPTFGGKPGEIDEFDVLQRVLASYFTAAAMNDEWLSGLDSDPDLDGRSNFEEIFAGSDPTVPDTGSDLLGIEATEGGGLRLTLKVRHALAGIEWELEESGDLVGWGGPSRTFEMDLQPQVPDAGHDTITLTAAAGSEPEAPQGRFYRIRYARGAP